MKCHDCGVEEGQLHIQGCDMEICPNCGNQLLSCGCSDSDLKGLPRIPWVWVPVLCALCGEVDPNFFKVPDREWGKFVPPNLQLEVLCFGCYNTIKRLFPHGWRQIS